MLLILVLEVVVAWFALTLVVAFVLDDLPMTTLWQRIQVLVSTRPATLGVSLVLAAGIVVPSFLWFQVTVMWLRVLWRRRQALQGQRSVE